AIRRRASKEGANLGKGASSLERASALKPQQRIQKKQRKEASRHATPDARPSCAGSRDVETSCNLRASSPPPHLLVHSSGSAQANVPSPQAAFLSCDGSPQLDPYRFFRPRNTLNPDDQNRGR